MHCLFDVVDNNLLVFLQCIVLINNVAGVKIHFYLGRIIKKGLGLQFYIPWVTISWLQKYGVVIALAILKRFGENCPVQGGRFFFHYVLLQLVEHSTNGSLSQLFVGILPTVPAKKSKEFENEIGLPLKSWKTR